MDRDTARQEIRDSWETILQGITHRAQENVNGRASYVCPICGHGSHGDGLTINPRSKAPGALKCFGCGFSGDIIDLLQKVNGSDFNTALQTAAAELGITIDQYRSDPAADFTDYDRAGGAQSADKGKGKGNTTGGAKAPQELAGTDYRAYYRECRDRLTDPDALLYLEARGISYATAFNCWIGYDPQADPAGAPGAMGEAYRAHPCPRIIIPTSKAQYVGRSIDPETPEKFKKLNSKGGKAGVFNAQALAEPGRVFVTEGVFDALSFMETGAAAVALNSKNNGQLLIDLLQTEGIKAQAFIICPDNDANPATNEATQRQAQELCDKVRAAGYPCIVYNVAGQDHDANDALVRDRAGFAQRVQEALEAAENAPQGAPLPGLLTYSDAVNIFETADDRTLELQSFPTFSKTAKIKLHDTVAIAADTGAGKSSLAINFLNDLNGHYPCIYINLEMDTITILRRLTAIYSGLELDRIEGYKNDEKTAEAVNISLKALTSRKPLQVIQGAYMLQEIEDIITRSIKGRDEPTIVFIDHSLLVDTQERTGSRYERFTQVSEGLRKMALRNDIILFVLLQQNRAGKANDDERPRNSSLKESGSWENDATHICFLWYDPADRTKKLLLTKNRGGGGGEFPLNYWKKTQTYTEAAEDQQGTQATGDAAPHKPTKRERQRQKLARVWEDAYINTFGHPTIEAMAEAADVTTSTIKAWIREYGGCIVDGIHKDPAGIDTAVEYTGFVKLTPADDAPDFEGTAPQAAGDQQTPRKRL